MVIMAEAEKQKPERYDPKEVEPRIQKLWEGQKIFAFDRNSRKPVFSIDTPPPFTSGVPHMGHALWWTWNDLIARYKRMKGFNVLLPQGWDCHGLPTELKVEKNYGIRKDDKEKFLKACKEWTKECIEKMKSRMILLGYSSDWSFEYTTDSEEYVSFVQKTLINLFEKGLLKREEHPMMWCTKCGTTLAKAEVGYVEKDGTLYYIKFPIKGEKKHITIATTRPELLPACVAVFIHPEDERYKNLIGKKIILPFFEREIEITANDSVDMSFGTGIVYHCTFGDADDIKWVRKYNLPTIEIIGKNGRLNEKAGKFAGLKILEARIKIIEELGMLGLVEKEEKFKHNVLCHTERQNCLNPIEFIVAKQWAIETAKFSDDMLKLADKIDWKPEHMKLRLKNWIESLDWNWIISRQRVFGTPIPFYYCEKCGEVIPGKPPVNPAIDKPPFQKCKKCGGKIVGETDTCDGWVDSSITPLVVSGYWKGDKELFKKVYPTSLRQQGHDIIRTWTYYTLLRCYLETGKEPWKQILVNGMVLGPDGREMHKSLGNTIEPDEVLAKHGADTIRGGLILLGAYGKDAPFSWKDMDYTYKFITKLWNIFKFTEIHLKEKELKDYDYTIIDNWINSKLFRAVNSATSYLELYQFNMALTEIENFIWHEVADNYLEMIKYRLYDKDNKTRNAALQTLYKCLFYALKLLAPFMPFVTEEIYQKFIKKYEGEISIHKLSWPEMIAGTVETRFNKENEEIGELAKQVISALRQYKSSRKLALNTELKKIIIDCDKETQEKLKQVEPDIKGTMKVKEIEYGKTGEISVSEKIRMNVVQ